MSRLIDIAGKRFGALIAIEKAPNQEKMKTPWLCRCDCGNEIIADSSELRRGRKLSCGCNPHRRKDISGQTFGRLTAIRDVGKRGRKRLWLCACECGNETFGTADDLASGHKRSCGCLQPEAAIVAHTTHGMSRSAEYKIWLAMLKRCRKPYSISYCNYGERGIDVCDEWANSFEAFYSDMGDRPSTKHSIDRIDNDVGYCKDNCRWATRTEQNCNSRRNRMFTVGGRTRCLSEWCREFGVPYGRAYRRICRGATLLEAVGAAK